VREIGGSVGSDREWVFGSPEYKLGEIVLAYLKVDENGVLRTNHLGLGRVKTRMAADGRLWLSSLRQTGTRNESLSHFVHRLPTTSLASEAVPTAAPDLVGASQDLTQFNLEQPESRWFDFPVEVWGDVAGDAKLGPAATRLAVQAGANAWDNIPASDLSVQYAGDRNTGGFICNPGIVNITFNDPRGEVTDPTSCTGILAIGGFCASGQVVGNTGLENIVAGAVVFNNGWGGCPFWNTTNVAEVVTHELGHTMGLAHSSDASNESNQYLRDATMYWEAHFDGRGGSVHAYDQGAMAFLYPGDGGPEPSPAATPKPTPTPSPVPTTSPASTSTPPVLGGSPEVLKGHATLSVATGSTAAVLKLDVHYPAIQDLSLASGLAISIAGDSGSYQVSLPAGALKMGIRGRSSSYTAGSFGVLMTTVNSVTTHVELRSVDPKVAVLAGQALSVTINQGGDTATGSLGCSTKAHPKKNLTQCHS